MKRPDRELMTRRVCKLPCGKQLRPKPHARNAKGNFQTIASSRGTRAKSGPKPGVDRAGALQIETRDCILICETAS